MCVCVCVCVCVCIPVPHFGLNPVEKVLYKVHHFVDVRDVEVSVAQHLSIAAIPLPVTCEAHDESCVRHMADKTTPNTYVETEMAV